MHWELTKTVLTETMQMIGSDGDLTYDFRLEIFKHNSKSEYRIMVYKLCYFDLAVAFRPMEIATEAVWVIEDSMGFDEIRCNDPALLLHNAFLILSERFEYF